MLITMPLTAESPVNACKSHSIEGSTPYFSYTSSGPKISFVQVMNPRTKEIFGPDEVFEKYGVEPSMLCDLQALTGDSAVRSVV